MGRSLTKLGTIAVWFSCGNRTCGAAKFIVDMYSPFYQIRVLNNPIKEEDADNLRFLRDVEKWIGVKIECGIFCEELK